MLKPLSSAPPFFGGEAYRWSARGEKRSPPPLSRKGASDGALHRMHRSARDGYTNRDGPYIFFAFFLGEGGKIIPWNPVPRKGQAAGVFRLGDIHRPAGRSIQRGRGAKSNGARCDFVSYAFTGSLPTLRRRSTSSHWRDQWIYTLATLHRRKSEAMDQENRSTIQFASPYSMETYSRIFRTRKLIPLACV